MKSEEEILNKWLKLNGITITVDRLRGTILSAMEEYASQFKEWNENDLKEAFEAGFNYQENCKIKQ